MATGKTRDDEVYEQGVRDGQNADFLDQFSNSLAKGFTLDARLNEIYQKGYQYGVTHRPAPEDRGKAEQGSRRQETVRRDAEAADDFEATPSNDNGCARVVGWLIGVVILVWLALWLAANVVLPLALLNSALVLCVLAFIYRQRQVLLASLALVGGGYMLVDIANGWLSANFVNHVVKNPQWLTGFVYVNALAVGVSSWLLLNLLLAFAPSDIRSSRTRVLMQVAAVAIAGALAAMLPFIYNRSVNPVGVAATEGTPAALGSDARGLQSANNTCGGSPSLFEQYRDMDTRRLPAADVANLSVTQLGFLRNYIYARHGRSFAKKAYTDCFSQFGWYRVAPAYRDSMLNAVEQANVTTLINQERAHLVAGDSVDGTFKGAWFEVAVPPGFTASPSMRSSTSSERYDSAVFRSPDGKVDFYIFSPQWKGEPSDIALDPLTEKQTSSRSETSRQRTVTWFTIEAKDGSYSRTYQDTRSNDGSTRWVVGAKYSDQAAFDGYREQYAKFKKSLRQFAD
jgi:hypothetical protein